MCPSSEPSEDAIELWVGVDKPACPSNGAAQSRPRFPDNLERPSRLAPRFRFYRNPPLSRRVVPFLSPQRESRTRMTHCSADSECTS